MHCQRNANNRQTGGFSESIKTGLAQQLNCTDCQAVNSRLKDQQKWRSDNRKCCSGHMEQSVDGNWWNVGASDRQHQTLERSSRWGTLVLDSGDNGGWSRQACTALAEGCRASAVLREVVLRDHGRTCWCRRSDVLRYSVLVAAHQWSSLAPRPGLSYSSPRAMWQRREHWTVN